MVKSKPVSPEDRRRFLTLFLLFFPTIIIIALGVTTQNKLVFLALSLLVTFFQLVGIKNFVDTHYQ